LFRLKAISPALTAYSLTAWKQIRWKLILVVGITRLVILKRY